MRRVFLLGVFLAFCAESSLGVREGISAPAPSPVPSPSSQQIPPGISTQLKPAVWKRVIEDRAIMTHADLTDDRYSFYATMLAKASLKETRAVLTDYRLYAEMVPYIQEADFDPKSQVLKLRGGIWKFVLSSKVRFQERGDRWIHFDVMEGHFRGMSGEIYFESAGEKGTAVFMTGSQKGTTWPPKIVIERGAEIVFEFTAKRMRSYLESRKESDKNDGQIPQPRSRF